LAVLDLKLTVQSVQNCELSSLEDW